ncbi:MAG: hypothetical protein EBY84_07795, partial [Acidimicrobiia bacterium]|nr:hypothetical protein [Acidimicrobiia bacterium]
AAAPPSSVPDIVRVDASPDLDDPLAGSDADAKVNPRSILEALLFVGQSGGEPLTSRKVASLMRGVRPQEVDDLVADLARSYAANNCPYEIVSKDAGWVMRLKPEFARFGEVLEARARMVRLDGEALDENQVGNEVDGRKARRAEEEFGSDLEHGATSARTRRTTVPRTCPTRRTNRGHGRATRRGRHHGLPAPGTLQRMSTRPRSR